MKHILFLTENLKTGGAERVLVNLVNRLDRAKYTVSLRTLFDTGAFRTKLRKGIRYSTVFPVEFPGVRFYLEALPRHISLRLLLGKGEYDVVVVYLHGILTRILSYDTTHKKVAWLHADMRKSPFMRRFRSLTERNRCFHAYHAIVGVSQTVIDSFRELTGITAHTFVKYNTIDNEEIAVKAAEPLPTHFFAPGSFKLVSVGRLSPEKGYERLIRVVRQLRDDGFPVVLYLIGDRGEKEKLRKRIEEWNLQERVFLLGYQENPFKFISKCDLYVCSSYTEGYSTAVTEAILCGTPVITTLCSGMREILGEQSEYGRIVENSEEALYAGIKDFLCHKEMLAHYRGKAQERKHFFDMQTTVREVEELLDCILEETVKAC